MKYVYFLFFQFSSSNQHFRQKICFFNIFGINGTNFPSTFSSPIEAITKHEFWTLQPLESQDLVERMEQHGTLW